MQSRRRFVQSLSTVALASSVERLDEARGSVPIGKVMVPHLSTSWDKAIPIVGDRRRSASDQALFPVSNTGSATKEQSLAARKSHDRMGSKDWTVYADFALTKDRLGRWHCIGNEHTKGNGYMLHHHVSDGLTGPYRRIDSSAWNRVILAGHEERRLYGPYVVDDRNGTPHMFYAQINSNARASSSGSTYASIRFLTTNDPRFEIWTPSDPLRSNANVVVEESGDRDPMVLWDEAKSTYFLYYCVGHGWKEPPEKCTLRVRTSPDMKNWSEPKTLMAPPPGYQNCESSFVLKKDGLYYLWVSGFDWGRVSLYISEDPLNFGDPVGSRIMEINGHTPEVVFDSGRYWIACAGISSTMGRPWGFCDLLGVYIQPLEWKEATGAQLARVTRS